MKIKLTTACFMFAAVVVMSFYGCASKPDIHEEINSVRSEMDQFREEIELNRQNVGDLRVDGRIMRGRISVNEKKIGDIETTTDEIKQTIEEQSAIISQRWYLDLPDKGEPGYDALMRAKKEDMLQEGRLLFEVTVADESVNFEFNESTISKRTQDALDKLAGMLVNRNDNIFIEIQGYTDNIGPKKFNYELGMERAKAVRNYLYMYHGLPLHRMDVFSFGEEKPIVPNDTPLNRAKNRRVVVVVMK